MSDEQKELGKNEMKETKGGLRPLAITSTKGSSGSVFPDATPPGPSGPSGIPIPFPVTESSGDGGGKVKKGKKKQVTKPDGCWDPPAF